MRRYPLLFAFKTILNKTKIIGLFQLERLDILWNFISSDEFYCANFDNITKHLYFINSIYHYTLQMPRLCLCQQVAIMPWRRKE